MERIKKFIYGFLAIYIAVIACVLLFLYHLTFPGPFDFAGISPVPGAEQVFHHARHYNLTGGTQVWVFEVPKAYYERLYKDCSVIEYESGPLLNLDKDSVILGTGAEKYLDPNAPSCYTAGGDHFSTYISEFRGDKLIIYYDHVL